MLVVSLINLMAMMTAVALVMMVMMLRRWSCLHRTSLVSILPPHIRSAVAAAAASQMTMICPRSHHPHHPYR
jgi:hypothetical protein